MYPDEQQKIRTCNEMSALVINFAAPKKEKISKKGMINQFKDCMIPRTRCKPYKSLTTSEHCPSECIEANYSLS